MECKSLHSTQIHTQNLRLFVRFPIWLKAKVDDASNLICENCNKIYAIESDNHPHFVEKKTLYNKKSK